MAVNDKVAGMTAEETRELLAYITRPVPYATGWWTSTHSTINPAQHSGTHRPTPEYPQPLHPAD